MSRLGAWWRTLTMSERIAASTGAATVVAALIAAVIGAVATIMAAPGGQEDRDPPRSMPPASSISTNSAPTSTSEVEASASANVSVPTHRPGGDTEESQGALPYNADWTSG